MTSPFPLNIHSKCFPYYIVFKNHNLNCRFSCIHYINKKNLKLQYRVYDLYVVCPYNSTQNLKNIILATFACMKMFTIKTIE